MENIFFDLKPIYSQWKIAFTRDHDQEAGNIFEPLSERHMISIDKPIQMSTYNFIPNKDEWKEKSPFNYDSLAWKDDINLGSISFSGGITSIVISQKLKEIIETFNLPKHTFYPVKLVNVHDKESRNWFLFYLPEHRLEYIDWSSSEFKLTPTFKDKGKVPIKNIGPGAVSSKEEFINLRTKYHKSESKKRFLEFHKVAYNVNYDVMWGNPNVLTISSKLRDAIVSENLKVDILERKELISVPN